MPDIVKASTHVVAGSHRLHSREPSLASARSTATALDKIAEIVILYSFDPVSIATDKNPGRTFMMAI